MKVLAFIALIAFSACLESEGQLKNTIVDSFKGKSLKQLFKVWHFVHSKSYALTTEEAKSRFRIFKENLKYIEEFNAQNNGATLGLNEFSDLTFDEFSRNYLNPTVGEEFKKIEDAEYQNYLNQVRDGTYHESIQIPSLPSPFDHKVHYPLIKNQGSCGSCWAFAVVSAIEGNRRIKGKGKDTLAPQALVDCDTYDGGCNGGWPSNAIRFTTEKGVPLETSYPYKAVKSTCRSYTPVAYTNGSKTCSGAACATSETYFTLLKEGPIVVAIQAAGSFMSYRSGVLDYACTGANHAMVGVGYGKSSDGSDHIIFLNSWGSGWGEGGFGRFKRNAANKATCFLEYYAWLPLLK
jgi:C1A family cysteine protease